MAAGAAVGAATAGSKAEPEGKAAEPEEKTAEPEEKTAEPEEKTAEPGQRVAAPQQRTAAPDEVTAAPAPAGTGRTSTDAAPAEVDEVGGGTAAPEEKRTDPAVPMTAAAPAKPTSKPPGITRDRRRRRRVLFAFLLATFVLAAFLGLVALVSGHGGSATAPPRASSGPAVGPPPAPPPPAQLPRGGTTIFPNHRVVAYYGTANTDRLGILGAGSPEQAAAALEQAAAPFATPGRAVLPAMELIVGVADGSPGPDGDYHHDINQDAVRQYLAVARAHQQLMIIDIQPGSSDFMTAVRPWAELLKEPDVGLALDPEWRMPPGQVPGKQIGTVSADEVNQVSTWLAGMVKADNLPQKLFVLHQFTSNMITNPERLQTPPELAVVQHIDGFGAPPNKLGKYQALQRPQHLRLGFKLFYTQDTPMLTPQQALGLAPAPDLITYQ